LPLPFLPSSTAGSILPDRKRQPSPPFRSLSSPTYSLSFPLPPLVIGPLITAKGPGERCKIKIFVPLARKTLGRVEANSGVVAGAAGGS